MELKKVIIFDSNTKRAGTIQNALKKYVEDISIFNNPWGNECDLMFAHINDVIDEDRQPKGELIDDYLSEYMNSRVILYSGGHIIQENETNYLQSQKRWVFDNECLDRLCVVKDSIVKNGDDLNIPQSFILMQIISTEGSSVIDWKSLFIDKSFHARIRGLVDIMLPLSIDIKGLNDCNDEELRREYFKAIITNNGQKEYFEKLKYEWIGDDKQKGGNLIKDIMMILGNLIKLVYKEDYPSQLISKLLLLTQSNNVVNECDGFIKEYAEEIMPEKYLPSWLENIIKAFNK